MLYAGMHFLYSLARVMLARALSATIYADAIIPLPRALFARLFTAFACECKRGRVFREDICGYSRVRAPTSVRLSFSHLCVRSHVFAAIRVRHETRGNI